MDKTLMNVIITMGSGKTHGLLMTHDMFNDMNQNISDYFSGEDNCESPLIHADYLKYDCHGEQYIDSLNINANFIESIHTI